MGTQSTANVILQGGQLVGDANRSLQSAVTSGFAQLQSSIKDSASIYSGMIASLNDVRRTEIDAWYKQESLKLQGRQLDIEKSAKEGELAYKNNYLKTIQEREKKEASKAPLVGALKAKIDNAQNEERQLLNEKLRLESIRDGYHFNKDGERITDSAGLLRGTPQFDENKASLDRITARLDELRSQTNSYNDGVLRVTLGEDPNNVMTELFGASQQPDSINPLPRDDGKFQPGDNPINPLLPNIEPDKPLTTPQPVPVTSKEKKTDKADTAATFIKPPSTPSAPQTAKPVAHLPLEEYYSRVGGLIGEAARDKKEPNTAIIDQFFQRLSKEDQEKVTKSGNNILRDFYIKAGEIISRGYESTNSDFNELEAVRKLSENYRKLLIQRGVSPEKITAAEVALHDDIIAFRQSETFNGIEEDATGNTNNRTKATIDFIRERAQKLFGEEAQGPPEPSQVDKLKNKHRTNSDEFLNPDGTLKINPNFDPSKTDQGKKDKESANRFKAFSDEFNKLTNQDTSGDNNFPVNQEYIRWINGLTPWQLGIDVNTYNMGAPVNYGGPSATPKSKDKIKKEMVNKIRIIISDPQKAFYFWLDKNKGVKPDQLPSEARKAFLELKKTNFEF